MYRLMVIFIVFSFFVSGCGANKELTVTNESEEHQEVVNTNGIIEKYTWLGENKDVVIGEFTNNTEQDTDLKVDFYYIDEAGEVIGGSYSECGYLKSGDTFYEAFTIETPFDDFYVEISTGEVSPTIKKDYEDILLQTTLNSDNTIDWKITDSSTGGYSATVYAFYVDNQGELIGYNSLDCGGSGEMEDYFVAPSYNFADYFSELVLHY